MHINHAGRVWLLIINLDRRHALHANVSVHCLQDNYRSSFHHRDILFHIRPTRERFVFHCTWEDDPDNIMHFVDNLMHPCRRSDSWKQTTVANKAYKLCALVFRKIKVLSFINVSLMWDCGAGQQSHSPFDPSGSFNFVDLAGAHFIRLRWAQ